MLTVAEHPFLDVGAFLTTFEPGQIAVPAPEWLIGWLQLDSAAPVSRSEELRKDVRDLLRHGGYRPTGRGKPACEYLVKAAENGRLGSINMAVDCCNAASLHGGLPISVVDLDRAAAPYSVDIAKDCEYVFNASGQVIDLDGLLCLFDAAGPCANAVKDSHRTKTTPDTTRTLSVVWGTVAHQGHTEAVVGWYRELLEQAGARTQDLPSGDS